MFIKRILKLYLNIIGTFCIYCSYPFAFLIGGKDWKDLYKPAEKKNKDVIIVDDVS